MSPRTRLMIADEFLAWHDEPGLRQGLIRGEGVTMSLAGGRHGKVALEIGRLIANHVRALRLGDTYAAETGFIVERDPDTVRGADVAFVRTERLDPITRPEKHLPFGPDPAVEILPPNGRDDEVEEKTQMWSKAGSLFVRIVDPESRTVVIHRPGAEPVTLDEDETIDGGDVIPGFESRLADFFS